MRSIGHCSYSSRVNRTLAEIGGLRPCVPKFELVTDANGRKVYRSVTSTTPTTIPAPGLPFAINFLVEPGMEHLALKAASAYQAASHRRVPPPMFPALPGEP